MPVDPGRTISGVLRWSATAVVLAVAAIAAASIWQHYVTSPWTRDGRVRVLVANVTPQVSGQIVELRIVDNQTVRAGDVLYVIDPFDFKVRLDSAATQVKMRAADLQVKRTQADRRQTLTSLAASVEEKQQYVGAATMAQAQFADAQIQLAQAEVNLKRTEVRSPVDGYVTNLQLRAGDYASTGSTNVSIVDRQSFWVDGYFEETKLAGICVGDGAEIALMGSGQPMLGRVESFSRGISVSDAASGTQGLPNVTPVYTWVRLAQRVPIRIRITEVPRGLALASGLTATVRIHDAASDGERGLWSEVRAAREQVLVLLRLSTPGTRVCGSGDDPVGGSVTRIPIDRAAHPLSPDQVNPGLAPAMDVPPR